MASDTEKTSRKGKGSRVFVWIILILLMGGLAGFGINGFGGATGAVGSVGKTEITIADYQRAMQQEISGLQQRTGEVVTLAQARQFGLDQRALRSLAATAALTEEARVVNLSVGDAVVRRELQTIPGFQGAGGTFDRDTYEFALGRNNLTPKEFEADLRAGAARQLLQQAVTGGLTQAPTYGDTLYGFLAEQRSIRWAELGPDLLEGENTAPTDEQLASFHEENADQFRTPEIRRVSYVWLTPDMRLDSIEVDEEALRTLYDERAAQYQQPARRLVERLGFADTQTAEAARAQIDAGDTTFEALVEARGLTLEDVDEGIVARSDLGAEAAQAVFALEEPGLTGPVETTLGPSIYRINAVLEAQVVSFEEARDDLLNETASDLARRDIADQIDQVDDLLVGGAALEDLANESDMLLGTIDYAPDTREDIARYQEFRTAVQSAGTDDFPEVNTLSDGGIFAIRLDEIIDPALPPLEDIRADVTAAWNIAETARRLDQIGQDFIAQLEAGTGFDTFGLDMQTQAGLGRTESIDGAPDNLSFEVFGMDADTARVVQDGARSVLVQLDEITAPATDTDEAAAFLGQLNSQASQAMAQDIFDLYGQAVQNIHGLNLNRATLDAISTGH